MRIKRKRENTIWYYISNYKFGSLFLKNFIIIFTVLYLPLSVVCIGGYMYFEQTLFKEVTASQDSAVGRIREIVDTVQANVESTAANLALDSVVNRFVRTPKWDSLTYDISQDVRDITRTITVTSGEYVDSIYIYSKQNGYLLSNMHAGAASTFYDKSWIPLYQGEADFPLLRTWGRVTENAGGEKVHYITTAYAIPYDSTSKSQGVILVNMRSKWLDQLIQPSEVNSNDKFYIVDKAGKVLYSNVGDYLGQDFEKSVGFSLEKSSYIAEEQKHSSFVTNAKSGKSGWNYVFVHPMTDYDQQMRLLKTVVALLLILLLLLAAVVSYFVSAKFFLPIKNIIQMMDDPKKFYEQRTAVKNSKQRNELWYITASFLKTVTKTEQAEEELIRYITKLKKTQAALLQTQINPHFLYNTLQTINFMAISLTKSDNQVSKAIGMLCAMFTQMMRVDTNTVAISDEIDYCKAYLEIELLRHGNEFDVEWMLDQAVMDFVTIKLTLQPILENAIKHGLNATEKRGKIRITAEATEHEILFTVSDNGTGTDQQWVDQMNEELQNLELLMGDHIGIPNVHQRIRLIFGNEYGLSYALGDLGGVEVRIVIPKVKKQP